YPDQVDLAEAWAAGDKVAIKRVDELLTSAGLTMDAVMAQTFCTHLNECALIDRMIADAEARRDDALHEIERHRATWGQELRRVAHEAAKTLEMEVIEDKSGKERNAACPARRRPGQTAQTPERALDRRPPRVGTARPETRVVTASVSPFSPTPSCRRMSRN